MSSFNLPYHEIRTRSSYIIASSTSTCISTSLFSDHLLHLITAFLTFFLVPMGPSLDTTSNYYPHFIFTELYDGFLTHTSICLNISLYFTIFITIHHIWSFIAPGLFLYERLWFRNILFISLFLFLFNLYLSLNLFLPSSFTFFLGFSPSPPMFPYASNLPNIHLEARIYSYISFPFNLFLFSNLSAQLPILILLFIRFGFLRYHSLVSWRRLYYFILILISAFFPPDLFTYTFLILLLAVAYEYTIIALLYQELYVIYNQAFF